jgi:cell wall-associated NlpC family hydrolase
VNVVAVAVTGLWRSPASPVARDQPLLADQPRLAHWLAAQGPAERRTLWGRLDSQLLLGEPVEVVEDLGEWVRVRAPWQPYQDEPGGYPGYVRAAHLAPAVADVLPRVVVTVPATVIRSGDQVLVDEVGYATVLPTLGITNGRATVRLPGGRTGWLPTADIAPHRFGSPPPSAAQLIGDAEQFLGVMYLAAGLHGRCYDCSGLVHAIFRRYGVRIPRDARDMAALGTGLPAAEAKPGDLLLFRKPDTGVIYHVGFALDLPRALHVSEQDWACIDTPLTAIRQAHLFQARRVG